MAADMRAIAAEVRMELHRMRNHFFRTTLAGSPFVPSPLRWVLYRATGLRIARSNVWAKCAMHNSYLEIGRGAFVNRACVFEGSGRIVIGERCEIGPQCTFLTSHHDMVMLNGKLSIGQMVDGRLRPGRDVPRDVVIGPRVWVGARATFLPGSAVESDVVVAAGAVVGGRLERGWVYGGVPAKKIRPVRSLPAD